MLERRAARRRRVCLDAEASDGLFGEPQPVRLRSLSDSGASVVSQTGGLPAERIGLAITREEGKFRSGRVVWRMSDRFGIAFDEDSRLSRDTVPSPLLAMIEE